MTKRCSKCGKTKPLSEFWNDKRTKDGKRSACVECIHGQNKKWRAENTERQKDYFHRRYKRDYGKFMSRGRMIQSGRPEAVVPWSDLKEIVKVYWKARAITRRTGIKHSVDHVIPLNNPHVCGLHVTNNLEIVPLSENLSKGSKWEPWWL